MYIPLIHMHNLNSRVLGRSHPQASAPGAQSGARARRTHVVFASGEHIESPPGEALRRPEKRVWRVAHSDRQEFTSSQRSSQERKSTLGHVSAVVKYNILVILEIEGIR